MIRADLHLHTLCSDGAYSPEEIARRVKEAGVSLFSVTDHDNMEGVERAGRAAKKEGLLFVRGMEISAYNDFGKVHVLGYCCGQNSAYERFLKERTEGAYLRADDSRQKANAYFGTNLTMDDVEEFHLQKNAPLHTMHVVGAFAKALQRGKIELYRFLFAYGKPAYSGLCRPTPEDAIKIIHDMGGRAVLAHPAQINAKGKALKGLLDELTAAGLDGIECYHTTHTVIESANFAAYAKEKKLLITGGSDFHSDGTERVLGLPEFYASDELLQAFSLA
ncbi:MAG: PHP domain-containing protein [Clostridia bacterium]|nr:PHP domain-containing protein [Clostridia bacterium]